MTPDKEPLIPSEQAEPKPPTTLTLKEIGKTRREWTLALYPAHLALAEAPGAQPYVILREEVMKTTTLIEGIRTLALKKPIKMNFKLTPEDTSALAEWIGKPVLAAHYLKRRSAWVLPAGVLWIIGSVPFKGDPVRGIASVPFDAIGLGLGLVLVVSWAWSKWRPHPILFVVDSLWFTVLTCQLIRNIVNGGSKGWLVVVVLALWAAITGVKHFARFRGTSIPRRR